MRLKRLILENFLTFDHLDYEIPSVPMQIQGRNLTDENQKSNGSGKSGMLTAIEYCIAATNSRDVLDKELVSFGYDESKIQLYSECDVRREILHITWIIKIKGSNKLSIRKKSYDGEFEDVSFSNSNDGKKYITSWFAISKEDLFNYFIVNKTRFKPFFKASNSEKVALINRFADASIVDGIDEVDNTELQIQLNELNSQKSNIEGKIELTEDKIENEQERDFKTEYEEKVNELKRSIKSVEESIEQDKAQIIQCGLDRVKLDEEKVELEEDKGTLIKSKRPIQENIDSYIPKFKELEEDLKKAEKLVEEFKSTDFYELRKSSNDELNKLKGSFKKAKNEALEKEVQETKILKFLQSISVKLEGSITCPNCKTDFVLDGDIDELNEKLSKGKLLKKKIGEAIDSSNEYVKSINVSISNIEETLSEVNKEEEIENKEKNKLSVEVNKINSNINSLKEELRLEERKISAIDKEISDCESDIKDIGVEYKDIDRDIESINESIISKGEKVVLLKENIASLSVGNNKDAIKQLKKEKIELNRELDIKKTEILEVEDAIAEKTEWANNFKQFKLHIANKSLEVIEYHCNRYLKGMGSDMRVKMEGYKTLSSGKIKDEITTKILRNGERTYDSFSGGERGRLLFASILANRHMINQTHPYGGLDFLSVDEVFEGIDSLGLQSLIESAKKLEVAVLIVTHVTDENVTEDVLLIEKINGISKIKDNG